MTKGGKKVYTKSEKIEIQDLGLGVTRKILSYDANMMAAQVNFEKGDVGAPHSHPHEQIGYVVKGSIEYHEDGLENIILNAGDSYYVAPNVIHGVIALEPTILLDVFTPKRDDFLK